MRGKHGIKKYFFQVIDGRQDRGEAITSGLKVSIFDAGTLTPATVYADGDKTALTNPITSTAFAALNNSVVEFWTAAASVDVLIDDERGGRVRVTGVTVGSNTITFAPHAGVTLVYANTAAGAELVDSAGAFVDFPHSYTLDASQLEVGDVIEIEGQVLFADYNGTDDFDLKILFGTEVVLQTGDVTPAANDDTITFNVKVKIETAKVAAGKISVFGHWMTDINGTVATKIKSLGGAAKQLTEDLSGNVVIKAQGDYSAEHNDNEAYLLQFNVFHHKASA